MHLTGISTRVFACALFAALAQAQPAGPPTGPLTGPPTEAPAPAVEPAAAATPALRAYDASYGFSAYGMNAGTSDMSLRHAGGDEWTFVARNNPRGLFRLSSTASLTLSSRMTVGPQGVQPLLFTAAQPDGSDQRAEVHFDWATMRATGVVDGHRIDMALKPGVQDDQSVQIALIYALLGGHVPAGIALFDKDGIRDYDYARVGEETLHTPMGDIDTVVYESHKAYSPRRTRFWCAPQYGYVPMRAEQKRDDEVQWTMEIRSFRFN